jgi:hypothetical protein
MINVIHAVDESERERLKLNDPFQLAPPVWKHYTSFLLPPETVTITIEERKRMPIKAVSLEQAPPPMHGKVSHNQDYVDVMAAIRNDATSPIKKQTALVVVMADPSWSSKNDKGEPKYDKPEVVFAGVLRRHFVADGLPLTAYASGKMEVTVKRGDASTKKRKK